jgi:hypothetical protein
MPPSSMHHSLVMSPFFAFIQGDDAKLSFLNQFLDNVMIYVPYTKAEI